MSSTITRHLLISGRVQGVAYRVSMAAMAQQLGVKGWVRNRVDGSVEAVAQGEPKVIEDFTAWAHQGPPNARVDDVKSSEAGADDQGPYAGFHVRADA